MVHQFVSNQNTILFHQKLNVHRVRNPTTRLVNDRLEELKAIRDEILEDYQKHPHCLNSASFTQNWDIVGGDFVKAIKSCGHLLGSWNSIAMTLLPKTKAPNTAIDYRTHSLLQYHLLLYNKGVGKQNPRWCFPDHRP